jgi:hypothetical protein
MQIKSHKPQLLITILLFTLLLTVSCDVPNHIIQPNINSQTSQLSNDTDPLSEADRIELENYIPLTINKTYADSFTTSCSEISEAGRIALENCISSLSISEIYEGSFSASCSEILEGLKVLDLSEKTKETKSLKSPFVRSNIESTFTFPTKSTATSHKNKQWKEGLSLNEFEIPVWTEGIEPIRFYTDGQFESLLKKIGLRQEDINKIKELPQLEFTPVDLPTLNNYKTLFYVKEGEAGILDNPTSEHTFLTEYIRHCIGVAIIAPSKSLFAHISKHEGNDNLSLRSFFSNTIPVEEHVKAKVILMSSCYSEEFVEVYKTLTNLGFTNLAINIQPAIWSDNTKELSGCWHYQASALDHNLLQIGQKSLLEKRNKDELQFIKTYLQENYLIRLIRPMAINAKTGELYRLNVPLVRDDDTESAAIENLVCTKNLYSKFQAERFNAPLNSLLLS